MPIYDSIYLRCPESWRGKIEPDRVRYLLKEFSRGRFEVLGEDPGWGKYGTSIRTDRQELNAIAKRAGIPPAVLLRRLIARDLAQSRHSSFPAESRRTQANHPFAEALRMLLSTRSPTESSSAAPATSLRTRKSGSGSIQAQTLLNVGGQPERFRDIEEIERAILAGRPISGEEQRRWTEAQKFKLSAISY